MLYIYIVPINNNIDKELIKEIGRKVESLFNFPYKYTKPIEAPKYAYNSRRSQFHSTLILNELKRIMPRDAKKILGIIDADLYIPELNFVFGEATDKMCIVSLYRLRQEFYNLPRNDKLFMERVMKEVIHELAHTFQLQHCINPRCVMFFSNSIEDTDYKSANFCSSCNKKLQQAFSEAK